MLLLNHCSTGMLHQCESCELLSTLLQCHSHAQMVVAKSKPLLQANTSACWSISCSHSLYHICKAAHAEGHGHRCCCLQGVFTSLNGGVGGGLGGLFGGFIYSTYGAASVFQIGLIVISVGWLLCIICQAVARCVCVPQSVNSFDSA